MIWMRNAQKLSVAGVGKGTLNRCIGVMYSCMPTGQGRIGPQLVAQLLWYKGHMGQALLDICLELPQQSRAHHQYTLDYYGRIHCAGAPLSQPAEAGTGFDCETSHA